ncbi:pyrimidine reductase family protein [Stackebrandtia nassauensis]|uniref:Bifunctional deaminase-reductase domain protein n=1 Tax=Stackebrandtia nassauensis (strain DSM 44728 / CIP 108903 / NRRL B-16338 / NBRC 102104 / LLR-40K-21) TaxID=446470 RepID=D3Q0T0_STANL|nr:pyrimidine reductase family protein [Stackebrandtia nassauensis]ADD43680.1 bifunctional deaminase-reductase domain protein [Stackebrandtia nassauensis DSM 44728]
MARYSELSSLDQSELTDWYAPSAPDWLRVNFVSSADGAVEVNGDSKALSGEDDMRVFRILRMRCDVLVVGAGTVRTDGYRALRLSQDRVEWRRAAGLPDHPVMAVVSRSGILDLDTPLFREAPVRPIVITPEDLDAKRLAELSDVADVVAAGTGSVDFAEAFERLRQRGLRQILCEGGPHVFGEITAAGLVDELCLTLSPHLAGAGSGRITAGPPSPLKRMHLAHCLHANGNLLLRYTRVQG